MAKRSSVVAVALVAVTIALGACTSSKRASAPDASTSTTPSSVTTTSRRTTTTTTAKPRPEYSFDNSVPPPELINTGTDYVAILKSFSAYGNWMAAHRPDPALTSGVVASGTKLHDRYIQDITRLRDNHLRGIERLGSASRYTILSITSNAFSAKVVEDIRSHRLVVANGRVTSEVRFTGPTTYQMLAVREGSRWYLAALDVAVRSNAHL